MRHAHLPRKLYTVDSVRAIDRFAIERLGIPGIELMERAGAGTLAALRERWPEARTLSAVCGSGNNGGDGYIVARLAHQLGWDVRVYPAAPPASLAGDARIAHERYRQAGGATLDFIPEDFEATEILVDALLGAGLDRTVTGHYAAIIEAINRYHGRGLSHQDNQRAVVALDIPSGLHADTGMPLGQAVKADLTVTMVALKRGLFTGEAPEHCGVIVLDELGIDPAARQAVEPAAWLDTGNGPAALARRARAGHKGRYGHVLVIGGDTGMSGAAHLAATAAARAGAGLVSVATRPAHAALLNLTRPELMCHGVDSAADLAGLLGRATVLAIGPGLGQGDWGRQLLAAALETRLPMVVDADALNLLAAAPRQREDWVLTPHPGEAARLLGCTHSAEIQHNRFAAARALQARYHGVIVLKGAGSLIQADAGPPVVCAAGNPGMASGGMGDVLTGVIAGLLAQQLSPHAAATAGVVLHATAGDLAARDGERGLLADDLMAPLRMLVNRSPHPT